MAKKSTTSTSRVKKTSAASAAKKSSAVKPAAKTATGKTAAKRSAAASKASVSKKAPKAKKTTAAKATKAKAAPKTVKKVKKAKAKSATAKAAVVAPVKNFKIPKCPLGKKELKEFREMLLEKRRTLLGDMSGMAAEAMRSSSASSDHSTMPVHMADIGTDNYEQEFTLGLLESERQLLREIDESLEQIAAGTYGVCMGTGKEIGAARLKAKPWAKYSIAYVRLIEQGVVRSPARDYGEALAEQQDDDE